jgi:hypothetical protein
MFVITADQKDSRRDIDRAGTVLEELNRHYGGALLLPVDRTAGDEIQALVKDPSASLALVLDLTRRERWSVGLGVGDVRTPLPSATREATGSAFIAARDAVDAAKRSPTRFALAVAPRDGGDGESGERDGESDDGLPAFSSPVTSEEVEALIALVLTTRDRRTPQGWEVADLLRSVDSQKHAAKSLGVTPQAVSTRVRTSGWRTEQAALPGLVKLLASLDSASS